MSIKSVIDSLCSFSLHEKVVSMVIEEIIHIHDKYQFEIKLEYQLEHKKRSTTYDIETYLFFPYSLGINEQSYSKIDFYNDIQSYIRLKTPTVLLQDMAKGEESPLGKLRNNIKVLRSSVTPYNIEQYKYKMKMFGCIFKSAIRDHVAFILIKKNAGDIEDLLDKYQESIKNITSSFRELRTFLNVPSINKDIFSMYIFGDEYLSLLSESYSYELLEYLKSIEIPNKNLYRERLLGLIKDEIEYRINNHYPSIPEVDSTNEKFIFRASVLKKYIGNVLFLNTRIKQEGSFWEQIVFAIAAGVAMMFAVLATFSAQVIYPKVSMPLFIILVVSYMFKDRIKELMRGYLGSKLRNILFDHKMSIFYSPKEKLGWCKESFSFVKDSKIPNKIMRLRNRDHMTEIENGWLGEKSILYRKRTKLIRGKLERIYKDYRVESINDIIRLNVMKFLTKMDNPQKALYVSEGDSYQKIYGKRVYHVNMIMKYSMGNLIRYKRFRIVLSQDGIKRIEEVVMDEETL